MRQKPIFYKNAYKSEKQHMLALIITIFIFCTVSKSTRHFQLRFRDQETIGQATVGAVLSAHFCQSLYSAAILFSCTYVYSWYVGMLNIYDDLTISLSSVLGSVSVHFRDFFAKCLNLIQSLYFIKLYVGLLIRISICCSMSYLKLLADCSRFFHF